MADKVDAKQVTTADSTNATDESSRKSNEHVAEYLKYYFTIKDPHYAVLINGPWGIGNERYPIFYERLCFTGSGYPHFHARPILSCIVPDGFITVLLSLHPNFCRRAFYGITNRYEDSWQGLEDEYEWIKSLKRRLLARLSEMEPITRFRIQLSIKGLDKVLTKRELLLPK